jgi:NADH-quinone oxidoreductase subunit N
MSFLCGLYLLVTVPVGNMLFSTGGLLVVAFGFLLFVVLTRSFLASVFVLLIVLLIVQPVLWILCLHSSGVGTEFSAGYTGSHLLDGITSADFKGLILVGVIVYFVTELHHRGNRSGLEPLILALIAVTAGLITFNVDNLITLYLNLELQALALYTLVGYNRDRPTTVDSALRYLLAGSLISAVTLVGFVQLYGINGTFQITQMHFGAGTGSIWILGMLLFKLGAAPFYFWTPTVYKPLDLSTLALVVGPAKINLWFLLVVTFAPIIDPGWTSVVAFFGLLSVIAGAVGGYFQTSATSLFAYSGILNTGYLLLLSVVSEPCVGFPSFSFVFYLAMYSVSTSAVLVVLSLFSQTHFQSYSFWSRLGKSTPLSLYYLVLNLAGLPVFPGFFAKVYLVQGLLPLGWLTVSVVVLFSIIPGLFYVGIAAQAMFAWSQQETKANQPGMWSSISVGALILLASSFVSFVWIVLLS